MKRLFVIVVALALLCAACSKTAQTNSETAAPAAAAAAEAASASADATTAVSATPKPSVPDGAAPTDLIDETKVTTDDFSIVTEDGTFSSDGAVYTITAGGEYTVSGLLSDGQLVVDADDGDVKLIFDNASISCTTGAPILIKSAAEVTVKTNKDSYNTVSDLRTGSAENVEDDAAIWAACDLKLSGSGTLIVTTSFDNGIKSKDDLSVKNLTLKVSAVGNALKGNDSVTIKSGSLTLISTASDGIKTENSDVSDKGKQRGTVTISGGQTNIYAACDGISAAYNVEISEDEACAINIYTASYASIESAAAGTETYLIVPISLYSDTVDYYAYLYNDDDAAGVWALCSYETMVYSGRSASYYGLVFRVPDGYRNILIHTVSKGMQPDGTNYTAATTGETLNTAMNGYLITAVSNGVISGDWVQLSIGSGNSNKTTFSSKGIKAENAVVISGGGIAIYAGDDGIHANADATLENGEASLGSVTIDGGDITICCADDGIHADSTLTINGGEIAVPESHEGLEANVITLNDGTVTVVADDDGLNACKGASTPLVRINGGYIEITTPSGDTDGIDSNGNIEMTGGIVIVMSGAQMGGMAGSVDADGTVTVTGGTIVALGGICQIPSNSSVNTYVSSSASFSAGKYRLLDANGNLILAFDLFNSYSSCWIASDSFVLNGSYSLDRDSTTVLSWTQSSQTEGSYQGGGFGGPGGFGGRR